MTPKIKAAGGNQAALKTANYEVNNNTSYKAIQGVKGIGILKAAIFGTMVFADDNSHITIGKTLNNTEEIEAEIEVMIDKLELICTLTKSHCGLMFAEFENIPECYGGIHRRKDKINFNGSKYTFHYCKVPLGDNNYLIMFTGKLKNGAYYLKLVLNPSKMTDKSWAAFHEYLETIFNYGYKDFYKIARVSYIEFAADLKGIKFEDLFVLDMRVTKYYDAYFGRGTVYLGVRKGLRQVAIYDKRKQLLSRGIKLPYDLTRIEARLCPKKLLLSELSSYPNPFTSIIVSHQSRVNEIVGGKKGERFIKSALGLKGFLSAQAKLYLAYYLLITSSYRCKQFAEAAKKIECNWWNPELLWAKGLEAIKVLNPPLNYY